MPNTFLTKQEIRDKASSIFTTHAAPGTSEKYTHIPTERIIDDMAILGWNVTDVKQINARKGVGYQKHMVIFRNDEIVIEGDDGDTVYPQILLTNSHDGKNAFTFAAGLYRLICSNGLVIATQEFENVKIRHYGYNFETLQETIRNMVERLPLTVESMNRFKQVQLGQEQALEFAQRALETRFKPDELEIININLSDLLTPTREQDRGSDLWSTFNVVQEKLVNGLFSYQYGNRSRKARKIKNFQQDMKLNSQLYELALEYAN